MKQAIERRVLNKINKTDTCWLWLGKPDAKGYGRLNVNDNESGYAHRIAYELWIGPIPKDKPFICHHCDTPLCINPSHLFAGTAKDNNQDCARKKRHKENKKTHCIKGHEYSVENTYVHKNKRQCRICKKMRKKL